MPCDEFTETTLLDISPGDKQLNLPEGVPPLTSLYLYIAGSCNLACRHCWINPTYQQVGNGGQYIKLEHVKKAIREAKPLGLSSVKLTGGEPTLHPQFREIVALIREAGLDIFLETNGTLVDAALAEFLKKQEVGFISVSLDGATVETHEALRMVPGSFNQAISGIKSLVEVGFHPQIIFTIYRDNLSQITQIVELAESLECGSVKFNVLQQVGRGERLGIEGGLHIPEVIQLFQYVENKVARNRKISIYFDIPLAFYPIRKLLDGNLSHCSITHVLGMLAGGELSLCGIGVNEKELIYGNIEKDDLQQVWCRAPGLIRLRELIPANFEGICGQCLHRTICYGACVANNYYSSGKLNAAYYFCDIADSMSLFPISRKNIILESMGINEGCK
jgi:SynChlorMet cassette radical SAM/SPASM protein ScmF